MTRAAIFAATFVELVGLLIYFRCVIINLTLVFQAVRLQRIRALVNRVDAIVRTLLILICVNMANLLFRHSLRFPHCQIVRQMPVQWAAHRTVGQRALIRPIALQLLRNRRISRHHLTAPIVLRRLVLLAVRRIACRRVRLRLTVSTSLLDPIRQVHTQSCCIS